MGIITVGRARQDRGFNVARPTALGNPFSIGVDGDRETVILKYREWLMEELRTNHKVQQAITRIEGAAREADITLLCFCAPKPCHADVITEILRDRLNRRAPCGEP